LDQRKRKGAGTQTCSKIKAIPKDEIIGPKYLEIDLGSG